MSNDKTENVCGPQPNVEYEPSHSTPLERLNALATSEHDALVTGERAATSHYWRLGRVLDLARKKVSRGDWANYLKTLGIEKTRASKAKTIYRTFSTVDKVADLSVAQAYEHRVRSPRVKKAENSTSEADRSARTVSLPHWVQTFADDAERLRDEAEFLTEQEARIVLSVLAQAVDLLVELQATLRTRYPESSS